MRILGIVLIISEIFSQSYKLEDCVIIALENKRTLLSANLGIRSSEKGVIGAFSNLLPNVSFNSGASRTNFAERKSISGIDVDLNEFSLDTIYSTTNHFNNISTGLSLNQTLYNGNRNRNQIKLARLNLDLAKLNERLIKTQVIQSVINSYFNLLQAYELLEVAKKNKEMSDQQVSLVKKQFDLGVVKKSDLLKARVAQGQAKVDLLNKNTTLENSRRVLFNDLSLIHI